MNEVGMTSSGQMAMFGLVLFLGVLLFAIVFVVLRSRRNAQIRSETQVTLPSAQAEEAAPPPQKLVSLKEALSVTQGQF